VSRKIKEYKLLIHTIKHHEKAGENAICLTCLSLREQLLTKMHRKLDALSAVAANADTIFVLWAE